MFLDYNFVLKYLFYNYDHIRNSDNPDLYTYYNIRRLNSISIIIIYTLLLLLIVIFHDIYVGFSNWKVKLMTNRDKSDKEVMKIEAWNYLTQE